jgi:hypothetical protein
VAWLSWSRLNLLEARIDFDVMLRSVGHFQLWMDGVFADSVSER